jgi:aryl-alcohol dehydrogenase-like predicted oxidoreductase
MESRPLGNTKDRVSMIGLGCAGMSGGYGTPDDAQSLAALACAIDNGIDFLDTADAYGAGHNEELLGRFLRGCSARVRIGTKFGLVGKPGASGTVIDNSPQHIRRACEASLRRLAVETLDLYYAHRRDPAVPIEEMIGAMADLVREGKVRHLGLCEVRPATLRRAHAVHPIAAVQSEYSLCTRNAETEMLDTCRALGVTFVAFCPLGRGLLAGTVGSILELDETDFRRRMPRFQTDALRKNSELVRALESFATDMGVTSAQVSLAWMLAKHPHVVPIPGAKRPRYVRENAAATRIELTTLQIEALDSLFGAGAVVGDRYPAAAMAGIEGS